MTHDMKLYRSDRDMIPFQYCKPNNRTQPKLTFRVCDRSHRCQAVVCTLRRVYRRAMRPPSGDGGYSLAMRPPSGDGGYSRATVAKVWRRWLRLPVSFREFPGFERTEETRPHPTPQAIFLCRSG